MPAKLLIWVKMEVLTRTLRIFVFFLIKVGNIIQYFGQILKPFWVTNYRNCYNTSVMNLRKYINVSHFLRIIVAFRHLLYL